MTDLSREVGQLQGSVSALKENTLEHLKSIGQRLAEDRTKSAETRDDVLQRLTTLESTSQALRQDFATLSSDIKASGRSRSDKLWSVLRPLITVLVTAAGLALLWAHQQRTAELHSPTVIYKNEVSP